MDTESFGLIICGIIFLLLGLPLLLVSLSLGILIFFLGIVIMVFAIKLHIDEKYERSNISREVCVSKSNGTDTKEQED